MPEETPAMTPAEAAAAIARIERLDVALRRRTSGLMWMLWGLVAPGIFMTFGFATPRATLSHWWVPLLWIPWVVLGLTMTSMLWRSAALVLPSATNRPRREIVSHVLLFLVVVVGGAWAAHLLHAPIIPPMAALAGLGVVSMIFGITGLLAVDGVERRVRFISGALLILTTIVGSVFWGDMPGALFALGAVASSLAFYGSGVWLVLRG